jgi:hypothetical protein
MRDARRYWAAVAAWCVGQFALIVALAAILWACTGCAGQRREAAAPPPRTLPALRPSEISERVGAGIERAQGLVGKIAAAASEATAQTLDVAKIKIALYAGELKQELEHTARESATGTKAAEKVEGDNAKLQTKAADLQRQIDDADPYKKRVEGLAFGLIVLGTVAFFAAVLLASPIWSPRLRELAYAATLYSVGLYVLVHVLRPLIQLGLGVAYVSAAVALYLFIRAMLKYWTAKRVIRSVSAARLAGKLTFAPDAKDTLDPIQRASGKALVNRLQGRTP